MTIGTIGIILGVVLLLFLKIFLKDEKHLDQGQGIHGVEHEGVFKEEPEFDRTWSFLPNNIFNRSEEDR